MQLGHMCGGVKNASTPAVVDCAKHIVDRRDIEVIRAHKLKKERTSRAEAANILCHDTRHVHCHTWQRWHIATYNTAAKRLYRIVIYMSGISQTVDIGLHSGVDRRVKLAQQWHELQPYAVATRVEESIGAVVDIVQSTFGDIAVDVGSRKTKQRTDKTNR